MARKKTGIHDGGPREVHDHALLRFDQPCSDEPRAGDAAGQQPPLDEQLGVDADSIEHQHREHDEDSAAQGEQDVVDEQLAGEADEVHPRVAAEPFAGRIADADDQPERDRQVKRREHSGVVARSERVDIGKQRTNGIPPTRSTRKPSCVARRRTPAISRR